MRRHFEKDIGIGYVGQFFQAIVFDLIISILKKTKTETTQSIRTFT